MTLVGKIEKFWKKCGPYDVDHGKQKCHSLGKKSDEHLQCTRLILYFLISGISTIYIDCTFQNTKLNKINDKNETIKQDRSNRFMAFLAASS